MWFGHAFLPRRPFWLLCRFPQVLWFLWRNFGRRGGSGLIVRNPLSRVCWLFALVFFLGRSFYWVESIHEFFEVDLGRFELLRRRIVVVRSLPFFRFFRGGRRSRFCRNRPARDFKEWTRHVGLGLSDPLVVAVLPVGSLPRSLCCKKGKWEESRFATGHPLSLVLVHQTKDKNLLSPFLQSSPLPPKIQF